MLRYNSPRAPAPQSLLFIAFVALVATSCQPKPTANSAVVSAGEGAELLGAPMDEAPRLALPKRGAHAPGGAQFMRMTASYSLEKREAAIFEQVMAGNLPDFMRQLKPVHLTSGPIGATIWVLPDYLSIGSDADFVRVPINLITALRIAHELGLALPTRRIVDRIHAQAAIRTTPQPMPPGSNMVTNAYILKHNDKINAALGSYPRTALVAGHKKDVVISNKLRDHPGRIVIYGWHSPSGTPIQPLSDVHEAHYADYSHGIRFVAQNVWVDGRKTTLAEAVADDDSAELFSDEGRMDRYGEFMESVRFGQAGGTGTL